MSTTTINHVTREPDRIVEADRSVRHYWDLGEFGEGTVQAVLGVHHSANSKMFVATLFQQVREDQGGFIVEKYQPMDERTGFVTLATVSVPRYSAKGLNEACAMARSLLEANADTPAVVSRFTVEGDS